MSGIAFLEPIRSDGLAHISYILGHGGEGAVIDPRRDTDVYLEVAERRGIRLTRVFETHRNEDLVSGALDLARRTGAEVHHGRALDFGYGHGVAEGETFSFGRWELEVLETPGHTMESLALVLRDRESGPEAIGVFSGDALFVGDVGRTDFYPDRAEEVAALLYDSIHEKILPLGDQAILYPAHGAGSVCGSGMAPRDISTLGHERRTNPALQLGRDEFIRFKVKEHHYQSPYFRRMEEWNLSGPPELSGIPRPAPLNPDAFEAAMEDGQFALDVRSPLAGAGAFVPGTLLVPRDMIAAFAGWFLPPDRPVVLVADSAAEARAAARELIRIGFDEISGYLPGVLPWVSTGRPFDRIPTVGVGEVRARIASGREFTLLDVREVGERQDERIPDSVHIFLGELPGRLDELPPSRPITTYCGSGVRAMIAASVLKRAGIGEVENFWGSMAAWKQVEGESD